MATNTPTFDFGLGLTREDNSTRTERFSKTSEEGLAELVGNAQAKSTKCKTAYAVKIFKEWSAARGVTCSLEGMSETLLDETLTTFYAELRNQEGSDYSRSTLLGIRYGLERYLNSPPHNKGLTITGNPLFKLSNIVLNAKIKSLRREGKENIQHKKPIEQADMTKLQNSPELSYDNPTNLLYNVWFNITLFWCRRGREGQRNLTRQSFAFEEDATGKAFATMTHNEASKNHQGCINDADSFENMARMYRSSNPNDGYTALKICVSKLNSSCDAFFQYPRRQWKPSDECWFENRPLGVNKLSNMMKTISSVCQLSRSYTNHCVRATCITLWSNAGLANRHIMTISGHRNEQSLQHYNRRPSTDQLKQCSDVLSTSFNDVSTVCSQRNNTQEQPFQCAITAVATVASAQESPVVQTHRIRYAHETVPLFQNCTIANVNITYNTSG